MYCSVSGLVVSGSSRCGLSCLSSQLDDSQPRRWKLLGVCHTVRHIFGVREVLVTRMGEGTGGGGGKFAVDKNVVVLAPAAVRCCCPRVAGSCWKLS